MKKFTLFLFASMIAISGYTQTFNSDSALKVISFKKDSTLRVMYHDDSTKVVKEYADKIKEAKFKGIAIYPALYGGDGSGVVPVRSDRNSRPYTRLQTHV